MTAWERITIPCCDQCDQPADFTDAATERHLCIDHYLEEDDD